MQLSFCLETLFTELPFVDRLSAAKTLNVENIEFWDYRDKDLQALAHALRAHDMAVLNFSGNRLHGMLDAAERSAFLDEVAATVAVAKRLRCPRLMLLVQPLRADGSAPPPPQAVSMEEMLAALLQCGRELGRLADEAEIDFVIEPLNTVVDHPGYVLHHSRDAFQLIRAIDHPRVRLLYDIYHMATMGESVLTDLQENIDMIGYIHVADAPGRHEPGSGHIAFAEIYQLLKSLRYQHPIGFEFFPSKSNSPQAIRKTVEIFI